MLEVDEMVSDEDRTLHSAALGLADVSLCVLRGLAAMRNIRALRQALQNVDQGIKSESRSSVLKEIQTFRDLVERGTRIEAVYGDGYLIDLDHPLIVELAAGGYFLAEERLAAARKRIMKAVSDARGVQGERAVFAAASLAATRAATSESNSPRDCQEFCA